MIALTTPQKNIWNLQKFYEGTSIANICGSIVFEYPMDITYLSKAIQEMVKHQSGMRLRFREEDGAPMQEVTPFEPFNVPIIHFESEEELDKYASDYAKIPFSTNDTTFYRIKLFTLDNKAGILICISHLIADAWTISLIATQTYQIYQMLIDGRKWEENFFDYLKKVEAEQAYKESPRYEQDKQYWAKKYEQRPEISQIKMPIKSNHSPASERYTTRISSDQTEKIQVFCNKNNVMPAVIFEAAMILYLSKINSENSTITIGSLVLNRAGLKEKNTAGMFVTTMPLTVTLSQGDTVLSLCNKITLAHKELFRHERYPYSEILHKLREKSKFEGNLYDVVVSYQNAKLGIPAYSKWYTNGYCEVPLEMHIDQRDGDNSFTITIDYQTELFEQEELTLLYARILYVVQQMVATPETLLCEVDILPNEEKQKVLYNFNNTAVDYPKDKCIHELFCEQVKQHPNKIALIFENQQFTYKDIDEMSNSLAHFLHRRGVKPGSVVPIIAKRSWHIIVAMIGILKAGGAYMPVDPSYPIDRIHYMTETAQCNLALTYGYSENLGIEAISLEDFNFFEDIKPVENLNTSDDICYVIFTSGSTGKPKGVSIRHYNVVNYSANNEHNICGRYIKANKSNIVSVTNIIFDIFVTESLLPLINGVCIYFADDEQTVSQEKLAELIYSSTIDTIQTTPTKMRSYTIDKGNLAYLKNIKTIILGGEVFPSDLYQILRGSTAAKIFNIYGPAETTVWSTNKYMEEGNITIGKPIANTQVYILDATHNPLPIGVAGELCISGDGVGKGYLNRPELTAEKFIPNPFLPGKTMYCTGDLARWREDGEIEYLGRIDTQVKIRGLRIELGEIESIMSSFDGVQLAAVADKKDDAGRQYLVGYYTSESIVNEKELRDYLGEKMPRYMVPNYFVCLADMPMTASGKIDRKNLPIPAFSEIKREYTAPTTETEKTLCHILAKLSGVKCVGITDDFFEIGGDSLRAIEYVAEAHSEGISFTLQNVFDYPTVQKLCAYMSDPDHVTIAYSAAQLAKYEQLLKQNCIDEKFTPVKKPLGNVFLTGATGFLGSHILDQLMKLENGKIYCLVRGGSERLCKVLEYYFGNLYTEQIGKRIFVVEGDITQPTLPENLPRDIQTVIHAAATVKHYGSYKYFQKVNVHGTRNIAAYAQRINAKMIHISTLSVSGNSFVDAFDTYRAKEPMEFAETSLYIGQSLDNVYVHSKFEAELVVFDAMLKGLNAKIIRVGNLTNRISDFKFQPNYQSNAFLTRFKAGIELGYLPSYLLHLYAEFSPIDQTADGIVKIAQYAENQTVFHLNSNRPIYFDRLTEVLNSIGISMQILPGKDFDAILQTKAKCTEDKYIYEAFQNDLDKNGSLNYESNVHILNDFTMWFMEKLHFEWEEIDIEYIKGYIDYFRKIGYFK